MSAEAIEVTLRSSDSLDGFDERRFSLRPNESVPIGRASKNVQKHELVMSPTNAFIDSPVISREHAVLSLDGTPPATSVYITDNGSMHGTTVNDDQLVPHLAHKLNNGDVLQFGIDITRNDHFYVARKFVFESSIPDNSFSRGFSVPDVESSEDEEVESAIMNSPIARYGTQTSPVTMDESQEVPPEDIEIEEDNDIVVHSPLPAPSQEKVQPASPPHDTDAVLDDHSDAHDDPPTAKYSAVDLSLSDESDNSSICSLESDECDEDQTSRVASDIRTDVGLCSVSGDSDEDVGDPNVIRRLKMMGMLNHERERVTSRTEPYYFAPPPAPLAPQGLPSPPTMPGPRRDETPAIFDQNMHVSIKAAPKVPEPEVAPMATYMGPISTFESQFANTGFGASKPMYWGFGPDYNNNSVSPRESNGFRMVTANMPTPSMFNYHHDVFGNFSDLDLPPPQPVPETLWTPKPPVPNDPPTSTAVASDISSEIEPQATRRTKVSIPEIVEEAPQTPLTPTSAAGNMKRKASVLDEDVVETVVDSALPPANDVPAASVSAEPASLTTAIDQRPKKRPRGRLGAAAKNVAAYLIPGTAIAVGLLTQLPEAFFQA